MTCVLPCSTHSKIEEISASYVLRVTLIVLGFLALAISFFANSPLPPKYYALTIVSRCTFVAIGVATLFFGFALRLIKKEPEKIFSLEAFDTSIEKKIEHIEEQIKLRESKLKILKDLVSTNQEFRDLCEKASFSYSWIFANYQPPDKSNLDPSKPIDFMTLKALYNNELGRQLTEWEAFIERHPAIYDCFIKCLKQSPPPNAHLFALCDFFNS